MNITPQWFNDQTQALIDLHADIAAVANETDSTTLYLALQQLAHQAEQVQLAFTDMAQQPAGAGPNDHWQEAPADNDTETGSE